MGRSLSTRFGPLLLAMVTAATLTTVAVTPAQAATPSAPRQAEDVDIAPPKAVFAPCGPTAQPGAKCGTVSVPLDRGKPRGEKIAIAFQLYAATDTSKPAQSTIVTSNGGPGVSNIALAGLWLSLLQPLLGHRNFLAIDHRGIGQSEAIDCPGLQHVQGDQVNAARECGAQLGAAAYRYGSGDVADDIDAVRQALHF